MADTAVATIIGPHGAKVLPAVEVDSYNLELKDDEGFLGDRASRQAFHDILENWRKPLRKLGEDPFGDKASDDLNRSKLDVVLKEGEPEAAAVIQSAIEEYAQELALVDSALPQGKGLGENRAHRDGRRLSRQPHRRTCDRAREPHPQGRGHQGRHGADP